MQLFRTTSPMNCRLHFFPTSSNVVAGKQLRIISISSFWWIQPFRKNRRRSFLKIAKTICSDQMTKTKIRSIRFKPNLHLFIYKEIGIPTVNTPSLPKIPPSRVRLYLPSLLYCLKDQKTKFGISLSWRLWLNIELRNKNL
jgi:hypothetical protein